MLAALVLVGLVLAAGIGCRSGIPGAVVLGAMSVLWLLVNGPMEGPILLTVTAGHGVTGGDLAGFAGLALAVVQGVRARHRPRSGRPGDGSATSDPTRPIRPGRAAREVRRR